MQTKETEHATQTSTRRKSRGDRRASRQNRGGRQSGHTRSRASGQGGGRHRCGHTRTPPPADLTHLRAAATPESPAVEVVTRRAVAAVRRSQSADCSGRASGRGRPGCRRLADAGRFLPAPRPRRIRSRGPPWVPVPEAHDGDYCLAMAMRRRSSGSMKWSWSSAPRSIWTQSFLPVNRLPWAV